MLKHIDHLTKIVLLLTLFIITTDIFQQFFHCILIFQLLSFNQNCLSFNTFYNNKRFVPAVFNHNLVKCIQTSTLGPTFDVLWVIKGDAVHSACHCKLGRHNGQVGVGKLKLDGVTLEVGGGDLPLGELHVPAIGEQAQHVL